MNKGPDYTMKLLGSSRHLSVATIALAFCGVFSARSETPPETRFFQNLNAGKKQTVVIYGTSLSAGGAWAIATKEWFDTQYPGLVAVVNHSGPGKNSDWAVTNLKTKVLDSRPDLVFIEFSYNDAHNKFQMPVEQGATNLEKIIRAIWKQNPNTAIVLQVMNVGWDAPNNNKSASSRSELEKYNDNYRACAKTHGLPLLDHYSNWLRLKETNPQQFQTYVPDGTHPNKEGSLAITWPTVKACLEQKQLQSQPDIVVYGGTSAGVAAAVQAARMKAKVVLVSPDEHLGGLSSGGLGFTDLGNPRIVGGISREFYHGIWQYYNDPAAWKFQKRGDFLKTGGQGVKAIDDQKQIMWLFEPSAAEKVFNQLVATAGVPVVRGRLDLTRGVVKEGSRITALRTEDGRVISGRYFIDATYEGDLMAKAGVSYTVGREPNSQYGETINGIQAARARGNNLPLGIDPYQIKGDPKSGLLPGVNPDTGGPDGAGDRKVQAYCYRMCLTDVPANRIPVQRPQGYDERQYELLFRAIEAGATKFFRVERMPNLKTDSNNGSGLSCDLIGGNYDYPEADYAGRERIAKAHEQWQRGLVWTLQNHARVPQALREKYGAWGLPKDEFVDNGNWATQLYVREARRMLGAFVETEKTLCDSKTVKRSIGMGAYAMDSHNVQRYVDAKGQVRNEGDVQIKPRRPYQIDYRAITPKVGECGNLLVPVCLSASHIAFGSIRMEPVFMILGQSSGAAACLALEADVPVQQLDYAKLRERLLQDGQILE